MRLWYARQAASEGWSRNVLALQIENRLHERAGNFDPGHLGQFGMYMIAVVAEYALRGYHSPIGVAEWATELETSMPADLAPGLPTIDELEAELAAVPPASELSDDAHEAG